MINSLVFLYILLFKNFGLSIIVFTIIVNLATLPLTMRQIRQTRKMSAQQPRILELREKYGNDRQKISQETMRIYRESGINPLGCLGPMIIQMPILLGLYWAIIRTLPAAPERLVELSGLLYSSPELSKVLPLNSNFLGLDLAGMASDLGVGGFVVAAVVGASMWLSMKISTPPPSGDGAQQQTQKMMQYMFPVMIGVLSLNFPLGLSMYWVASSAIRACIQLFTTGKLNINSLFTKNSTTGKLNIGSLFIKNSTDSSSDNTGLDERKDDGADRVSRRNRQDRGRSNRNRSASARGRQRQGRNRNRQ
jgi:YidC/Oxa1 family membrane protein insertase